MNKIMLPMELINKILIMRPTHPTAQLLKNSMAEYITIYDNELNYISFQEYLIYGGLTTDDDISFLFHIYSNYDIKIKCNRNNNNLRCHHCGLYLLEFNFYYNYFDTGHINCFKCFDKNN